MMKSVFSLGLFATAAVSQSANIGLPQKGAQLTAGSNETVQVQRPVSLILLVRWVSSLTFVLGYVDRLE